MKILDEMNMLNCLMLRAYERHGSFTHRTVVRISQMLDRKLNEYERLAVW